MNNALHRSCRRLLAFALMQLLSFGALASGLVAYTEEWAPYNYSEDGTIKGISSDALRAMCDEANVDCKIVMVPWARAYSTVANTPNTLIYTIARTPTREDEFAWVGPLLPRTVWIYTRPGKDAKDLTQLRFGVVRDDASTADLLAAGVPASSLVADSSNAAALKMYRRAMVDALVDTEIGMAWNLRMAGVPANSVARQTRLSDAGAYYFALNRNTDPQLVHALQQALDKIKHDGTLEAIKRKYLD